MSGKRKRKSETNVPAVHEKRKLKKYFLSEQENDKVDERSESDNEGKNSGWVFDEYLSSDSDTEDENSAFCVECVEKMFGGNFIFLPTKNTIFIQTSFNSA